MFLVELVMQGVRGFQQVARLRFQGGFNIVTGAGETGKTTSVDTAARLLFPASDPARMDALVSRATPDASRGALVIFSDDGSYYQLIQDFSKRAVNLSKHDPSSKKFVLQQKDWNSAIQFMTGLLPGISEEDYGRLFLFRRDSCSGSAAAAVVPGAGHASAARTRPAAGRSLAQEAKLNELRETLRKAEEAADAEYKADAARLRLGEIGKKLERLDEARNERADLEARLEELKVCETFPENLAELIGDHEQQQSQKLVRTDELDGDIEALTIQRDGMPAANVMTEKLFIAGVATFVLALVAGLFFLSDDQAIFFPLGMIGALLLVAAGWYNSSRRNAQRKEVQKEIDALVKERAEVERKFQDGGATILKFMKAAGAATAGDLKEKADNHHHFRSLLQDLEERQRLTLGGQDEEALRAELAAQEQEVAALTQAAKAVAHHAVDTYSVRQEIERLEGELAPAGGHDPGFGAAELAPSPSSTGGVNVLSEIAVASRVSGIEMETLVPAVESAAQRNLQSASGGKYVKVEVGPDGQPVVHDRHGAKHPFSSLSHGTRDLVCFCVRAGIVEAIAGKRRLPFLLDDPFTGLDPARQTAACQVLRVLGTKTQVILFTSNAALRGPNDAAAELK
jgi:hypothetical protein